MPFHSIPALFNPPLFIHWIELNWMKSPVFFFYVPFSPLNPRFTENSHFWQTKNERTELEFYD